MLILNYRGFLESDSDAYNEVSPAVEVASPAGRGEAQRVPFCWR